MREFEIGTIRMEPGSILYFSLAQLAHAARAYEIDFGEWGLCELDDHYWVGTQCGIKGKEVLRVSVLDAFEKRNELYPDWGDEEVFLFAGRESTSRAFQWFLLSEEDWQRKRKELSVRNRSRS